MKRRSCMTMIAIISLLASAGISLNAAPQLFFSNDLTLHETTTSSGGRGGDRTVTVTNYLSGNAMKRSSSDGKDAIFRLDQGKIIEVDNNKKTYSEITFQQLQEMMDKATAAMGQDKEGQAEAMAAMRKMMGRTMSEITVTKLGPGENIAGFATEKYLVKGPMEMEIWAAPELKLPGQYYDVLKARMPRNPMFDMGKLYDEMKKINGMTMKSVTTIKIMTMETKTTTVVTSVEKGSIPKSVFEVPAGYQKVDSALK